VQLCVGGHWTRQLLIVSPTPYRYATVPPQRVTTMKLKKFPTCYNTATMVGWPEIEHETSLTRMEVGRLLKIVGDADNFRSVRVYPKHLVCRVWNSDTRCSPCIWAAQIAWYFNYSLLIYTALCDFWYAGALEKHTYLLTGSLPLYSYPIVSILLPCLLLPLPHSLCTSPLLLEVSS